METLTTFGERIARARAGASLSLRALAEQVGVSHTAIAKYERGENVPASDTLLALARATGVGVEYFFRPTSVALVEPEYRKHARLGTRALARVEASVVDEVERLLELISAFPVSPVPAFTVPVDVPHVAALADVEIVADLVRSAWGLGTGPIADLTAQLEERGVLVVTTGEDKTARFDGLAATVEHRPVLVVGEGWPGDRQRFTLAHELGHLVLRDHVSPDVDLERACNRFAGALLVPRAAVVHELGPSRRRIELQELVSLKRGWGVSMAAWVFRARDVDVIDADTFIVLQRTLRARGWHRVEPGGPVPSERPSLLQRLVLRALAEEWVGESKAAELLDHSLASFRAWRALNEDAGASARL